MGVEALTSFQRPGSAGEKQKKAADDCAESFHIELETYNRMPSPFQVAWRQPAVIPFPDPTSTKGIRRCESIVRIDE